VDAHNGGLEAKIGVLEGLETSGHRVSSLRRGAGSESALQLKAGSGSALQ
jgi:hypothetical protein